MNHPTNNLKRLTLEFIASAPDLKHCPSAQGPEVAIAGRSNAGKSSVLNQLSGNRRTAKVSKTPGRTQLLNFFKLIVPGMSLQGTLVDLPGYGFAKAGRSSQIKWQQSVNHYLANRDPLVGVVMVTDIRHPGQPLDLDLINWAQESEIPLHILLNKADKLKFGPQKQALNQAVAALATPTVTIQLYSAQTGLGQDDLIARLLSWLDAPPAFKSDHSLTP
ncbi:MAG: ribosome biogenesis GTP-binding protein YihA/YsxC [Proteobacteria bacterium]|nr:ribosome biogenesis GTP-binding protein YihA/YsxC [Pseudomonadota bacterium]